MNNVKFFRFIPVWEIEKAERWLSDMEANGFRLEKVSFFRLIYHFKPSYPHQSTYFFTYSSSKGKDMSMIAIGLEQQYSARKVQNRLSTLSLYRIMRECDLTFEKETRLIYFRMLALESFLLSCMTLFVPFLFFLGGRYGWALFVALLTLPIVGYNLYGLCRQTAKASAYNKRKRKQ